MKNILVAITLMIFSTSAFAGSCPMMAGETKNQNLFDANPYLKIKGFDYERNVDGNQNKAKKI